MMKHMLGFFFFIVTAVFLNAKEDAAQEKTICLNMIVKNESHVIEKCLASVKPIIDYWVIVDTGSTDGTQDLIKKYLKGIPGELHERPWKDFAHNRNQALQLAKNKADYLFFIDADEQLEFTEPFDKSALTDPGYLITIRQGTTGIDYLRMLIVDNKLEWKWEGVLHENLTGSQDANIVKRGGIIAHSHTNGFRSKDPDKYLKDAQVLERALEEEPGNSRYVFYLAQSYINVPDYPKALKYYKMRSTMGGWNEEVFFAKYCVGMLQALLGYPSEECIKTHSDAYQYRPQRAEPLYRIAEQYIRAGNYVLGLIIANHGLSIPLSNDSVFVENWIYDWGLRLQVTECLHQMGNYPHACQLLETILAVKSLPQDKRAELSKNYELLKAALEKQ